MNHQQEISKRIIPKLILALLFVNILLLGIFKLGDYDIWYHLSAGRYIIETGSIIHNDPFSYTASENLWSLQSWLAGVVFFAVHSMAGINGLILFNALVIMIVFLFLFLNMQIFVDFEKNLGLLVVILIVAAYTARIRFMVRPHIFEFLFLSAVFYLLNLYKYKRKNYLFIIPIIQLLWVNIHGSHILGLLLPLIYLVGECLQALFAPTGESAVGQKNQLRKMILPLVLVFIANLAVTLINPGTYHAFSLPFLITGQEQYMKNIGEWQPLRFSLLWGYGLRYTWGFVILAVLFIAAMIRHIKKIEFTDVLLFLFFLLMAIRGIRLTAEFAIIVSVLVFKNLQNVKLVRAIFRSRLASMIITVCLILVLPWTTVFGRTYEFGLGVKEKRFPEKAVQFLENKNIPGKLYNSFGFGDFLCWRIYPSRRVFIHGRNEVFSESLFQEYLKARDSAAGWKEVTEKYDITCALIQYSTSTYGGMERNAHLNTNSEWLPVYWDMTAILYLKDVPANSNLVERYAYKYLRPSYFDFSYLYDYLDNGVTEPILDELERLIRQDPYHEEAHVARAVIYFYIGSEFYEKAENDLIKAISINGNRALSHSALGILYQMQGKTEKAQGEYKTALELNPQDPTALANIKNIEKSK